MTRFLGLMLLLVALSVSHAGAVDEEKPYGRGCVSILDSGSGKEEPFKMSVAPKQDETIKAHIDVPARTPENPAPLPLRNGR